jgi:hypothetical protein
METKDELLDQEFTLIENEEQFLEAYPPVKWGEYRPQPNARPSLYPCMIREEQIVDNPDGADEAVISIVFLVSNPTF